MHWFGRLLAFLLTALAAYLVYANVHAGSILLECTLAAAVLSIATLLLAWKRPVAAVIMNAVWIAGAFIASASLAPNRQLPNIVAQGEQRPATLASVAPAPAVATRNAAPDPVVAAVARKLGSDPQAMLSLVSGGIRYEVYPGVFRGAVATLADGFGNDYDRALLLHDLLASSNSGSIRYAFCTLSPQQAAAAATAARNAYVVPVIGANTDKLAQSARTPVMRSASYRIANLWNAAILQERQQATELASDFKKANAQLAPSKDAGLAPIAADHVWVQLQRNGQWTDLDPSVPHAKLGAAVCSPAKTSDALPESAFDTVTVTMRYESRDGAKQNEAPVGTGTWRTAELARTPLIFAFAESSGLSSPAPQPTGMRSYTPLLVAGTQKITAPPITVPAPVGYGMLGAARHVATQGASQTVTAFGTTPPATPTPAPTPTGPIPVALRLSVAVSAPNFPMTTVDHVVFDRVSVTERAAGRAATAPIAPISLLPFGTVLNIAVNLGTGVVGVGGYGRVDPKSTDPANVNRGLGAMHRAYYTLRRAAFADLSETAPPIVTVRPGVSFLGFAPYPAGPTEFGVMMDRAGEGAAPDGGDITSNFAWGVASLYGERLAVGSSVMATRSEKLDQLPFDDSIEMFYIARHTNVAPVLVRSPSGVGSLSVTPEAKARLAASIANGASAVVPSSQVSYGGSNDDGWWIVAADGSSVTDEMQSGMHPDFPEEGEQEEEAAEQAPQEAKEGGKTRCAIWVAGAMFIIANGVGGLAAGGEEGMEYFERAQEVMHAMEDEEKTEEIIETAEECEGEGGGSVGPPPPGGPDRFWHYPYMGPGSPPIGKIKWPIIP